MENSEHNHNDLEIIKRSVLFQFGLLTAVIVCGGIAHGVESGRWLTALTCAATLLAGTAVAMGMTFQRAKQRLKAFSR